MHCFTSKRLVFTLFLIFAALGVSRARQSINKYEDFELKEGELYWTYTYSYPGNADSIRRAVVQLLKSKAFTRNVIRNEIGYNGEIDHYEVDCKRYNRKYVNTARIYWEGEWTGKFMVEIKDNRYHVTVYGLYYEIEDHPGYYKTMRSKLKGRYVDVVARKDRASLRKAEFEDMSLMNLSLKDQFDIKYSHPIGGKDF